MRVLCLLLYLVAATESVISLYLLDFNSGKALTANGIGTIEFSPHKFGDKSQLWRFTKDGDLIVTLNDKYLGYNHAPPQHLEMADTRDVTWYWEDMKIRAHDQSTSTIVCIGGAVQVVSCDKGANITLQVYDSEVFSLVEDINSLVANTTKEMKEINNNITSTKQTVETVDTKLGTTEKTLADLNINIPKDIKDFETQSKEISTNITQAIGKLDLDIADLKKDTTTLSASVLNITNHINTTTFNFTALENALKTYKTNTNKSIEQLMTGIHGELDMKSTNGHIIPDNGYEFAVLFLLALGIVNVFDIARRLIAYAINQVAPAKYGAE